MSPRPNLVRRAEAVILWRRHTIAAIMADEQVTRRFFHAVVMWPSRPASEWSFDTAILVAHTASEDGETQIPEYEALARQAACAAWESLTGPTSLTEAPDSPEVATVVLGDDPPVIVSVSGQPEPISQAIADCIAQAIAKAGPWPEIG